MKFLRRSSLSGREQFLQSNLQHLTAGQVDEILNDGRYQDFSPTIRGALESRASQFRAYSEKQDELNRLRRDVRSIEHELSGSAGSVDMDSLKLVFKQLERIEDEDYIESGLEKILTQNEGKFDGSKFTEMAKLYFAQVHRIEDEDYIESVIARIYKASRSVYLTPEQESSIKELLSVEISRVEDEDYIEALNEILGKKWGKNGTPRTREEIQRALQPAQAAVAAQETEVSRALAALRTPPALPASSPASAGSLAP